MPVSIPYEWSQDADWININAQLPLVSIDQSSLNQSINLIISPSFIQWNHPPCLMAIDLLHPIDTNQSKYVVNPVDPITYRANSVTIRLRKCESIEWNGLIDESLSRTDRIERRQQSIAAAEQAARARYQAIKEQSIKQSNIEREALWSSEESMKQSINSAKTQDRVVTLDEMKRWTSEAKKEEEAKQQLEQSNDQSNNQRNKSNITSSVPLPQRSEPRPPVNQSINHPVRSTQTARIVTSFTAPNPKFPSLPARESNNQTIDQAIKQHDSASVTSLLEVKDRADTLLRSRDYVGAINAYNTMLDNPVFKDTSNNQSNDSTNKEPINQYMTIRCRMLSNLSGAHSALAFQTSIKAISQSINQSNLAIDAANQSLRLIHHLIQGDQLVISSKLHSRLASNHAKWGRWTDALKHWQQVQSINQSINQSTHAQAVLETNRIEAIRKALQDGEYDRLIENARKYSLSEPNNQSKNESSDQSINQLIESLTRALELNPTSVDAFELRMRAHQSLNQWKEVVRDVTWTMTLREEQHRKQSSDQSVDQSDHSNNQTIKQSLLAVRALAYHRQAEFSLARSDLRVILADHSIDQTTLLNVDHLISRLNDELAASIIERDVKLALSEERYEQARAALVKLVDMHAALDRMQFCTCNLINQSAISQSINQCACEDDGAAWMLRHCVLLGEVARCEMKMGNFQQASSTCSKAIRLFDQSINQSEDQLISLTAPFRDWRAQISVKLGTCALELGDMIACRNAFAAAQAFLSPDSPQGQQLAADLKRIDDAIDQPQET